MNHNYLDFDAAHAYVEQHANGPREVFWDGYDVVIFKRNPGAYMVKNGMYRNGQWGTTRRVKMTPQGSWRLPVRP